VRDPYELLGVDRSATQDDIKAAFRKLAQQHHPDKNPDDPSAQDRFKQINAAYQILSDPAKRQAFDRFGQAGMGGPAQGGVPGNPFGGMPFDMNDINLDGVFGDLLGALGIKVGDRGGIQREIKLTFEEAAFGCTKEVTYERAETCTDCAGSGSAPGAPVEKCSGCAGRGRVRVQQGIFPIQIERPCPRCRGTGRQITDPCKGCRGAGLASKPRTIEVTIPPGVENGTSRVVERGGNVSRPGAQPGELEIVLRVAPHELFRRVGDDVVCALPITFAQAALGAELEIPTLEGKGKLRVPAGTQPGSVLRVRNKGIPKRVTGGRGDQLVEVTVEIPTSLNEEQRALIQKLGESLGETVQPQQATFMDKLRALFG
jgi:molecular chaperone DnaJ